MAKSCVEPQSLQSKSSKQSLDTLNENPLSSSLSKTTNNNNNILKVSNSADGIEIIDSDDIATFVVMMKGAPEVILSRCSTTSINGELTEIRENFRSDCMVKFLIL